MPRPKKPTYEFVEKLGLYRKRIKDTDGKYIAIYGKTADELTDKIKDAQQSVESSRTSRENPTVSQYSAAWLNLYTSEMPNATANVYKNAVKVHIVPAIGSMHLQDVSQDNIKAVLVAMAGMSASMQSKVLNTMRKIFEAAVDNDLILKNPCAKVSSGGKKTEEKEPLTDAQAHILIEAVRGTRAEPFVMLGLYSGMRREEILGLKWDSVHLDGKAPYIAVKRALRWDKCRPIVSDELKSKTSKRNIPIPAQLVNYLKPVEQDSDSFVVGGTPLSQQQYRNLWRIIERREVGETVVVKQNCNSTTKKVINSILPATESGNG